jgi:hypothetical protein
MSASSYLKRAAQAAAGLTLAVIATAATIVAYPEPLFAYHLQQGRLELWSDRPFEEEAGRRVLADVERRLSASSLNRPGERFRIFTASEPWRRRLVFLWNDGAGGVAYGVFSGNVFLRASNVEANVLYGPSGVPAAAPRTLAYYAAHEIGHSLTVRETGLQRYFSLPRWVREGVADYIGLAGDIDIPALARKLREGAAELDPARSGRYSRYHLLVAFLVKEKGWSLQDILRANPDQAAIERAVLQSR